MNNRNELISNERLSLIRSLGNSKLSKEEREEAKKEYSSELDLIKSGFYDESIFLNEDFQDDFN